MIALLVWSAVAVLGVLLQGRAWARARRAEATFEDAPPQYLVLARNNRRRYFWRTLICVNNLILALALGVTMATQHGHPPFWLGTLYFSSSLIANEAIVIVLTWLDGRTERRVHQLTSGRRAPR